MTETNDVGGAAVMDAAVPSAEASAIAQAVEEVLAKEKLMTVAVPVVTVAAAEAAAWRVYYTWRNTRLGTLPPDAFRLVEAAAPDLIAAIVAEFLTTT